jgi:D-glycero-D-manno-heptose 1,7-bisphosphate phosphatase
MKTAEAARIRRPSAATLLQRRRAVFLDRDGVINKPVFRDGRPCAPRQVSEFAIEPDVEPSLRRLRAAGFLLFVVTNQPDVARGQLPVETLRAMNEKVMATLALDEIKVCPHDDGDECNCRKPRPQMLLDLAGDYNLALDESYIVGDSWKDTQAGKAAGCNSIIIDRTYNHDDPADYRVANISSAVNLILRQSE